MQELYQASNPQHLNEAVNVNGPNRCTVDSQCDGFRTCSSYNWCQGWAGTYGVDYGVAPKPAQVDPRYGETHVENYEAAGTTNFNNSLDRGDTIIGNLSGLQGSVQNFGLLILM